jgi:hypothetical protein
MDEGGRGNEGAAVAGGGGALIKGSTRKCAQDRRPPHMRVSLHQELPVNSAKRFGQH